MKKANYRDLMKSYIASADARFSGFYGDESTADWANADATSSTSSKGVTTATPYVVVITNTTTATKGVVLFGKNQYYVGATNYGSDTGIVLTTGNGLITYVELLAQSGEQNFEVGFMRVSTSGTSASAQILTSYTLSYKDANGKTVSEPIIAETYFAPNQFQSNILDIPTSFVINGNTSIEFDMLGAGGDNVVRLSFFPTSKVNATRSLAGKDDVVDYKAPYLGYGIPQIGGGNQ